MLTSKDTMITYNQFVTYCSRNHIQTVAFMLYGPEENQTDIEFMFDSAVRPYSLGLNSMDIYMSPGHAYKYASANGIVSELYWAMREDMARKCPRRAIFLPHRRPLIVIDDELPF